ncbi:MAG: hypothetical protein AAGA85_14960 [Bacteroidota bacterium]
MRAVKYVINYFFGKPTAYSLSRDKADPSQYAVIYEGMAIYTGSYESCQRYING